MVEHVEILVEEPSAEAFLRVLLPKVLRNTTFRLHVHQGKTDLLKKLPPKLRAYSRWIPKSWRILVLVDRDNEDCVKLKKKLVKMADDAGLSRQITRGVVRVVVVNRIAVEELEAWYFGDWQAVSAAYPNVDPGVASQAKYRIPDKIAGGTWEAFERVLQKAGYFTTGLRKIEAARTVAERMLPERNSSHSFGVFWGTIKGFARG
jgi:hypothetical protein